MNPESRVPAPTGELGTRDEEAPSGGFPVRPGVPSRVAERWDASLPAVSESSVPASRVASPGPLERAILAALELSGPCAAWHLSEVLGTGVARVEPLLRDLRARGLVVAGPDAAGVTCWRAA